MGSKEGARGSFVRLFRTRGEQPPKSGFGATAASPQIATMDARNLGVHEAGLSSTLTQNL